MNASKLLAALAEKPSKETLNALEKSVEKSKFTCEDIQLHISACTGALEKCTQIQNKTAVIEGYLFLVSTYLLQSAGSLRKCPQEPLKLLISLTPVDSHFNQVAQAIEDLWLLAPEAAESAILEFGLLSVDSKVRLCSLGLILNQVKLLKGGLPFRAFTNRVTQMLNDQSSDVRKQAYVLLVNYFRYASSVARQDLEKQLDAHAVSPALKQKIVEKVSVMPPKDEAIQPSSGASVPLGPASLAESIALNVSYDTQPLPSMDISALEDLDELVEKLKVPFDGKETELNWRDRESGVLTLRKLLRGNMEAYPNELANALEKLSECVSKAILSLRTALSQSAIHLLKEASQLYPAVLEPLLDPYLPALVKVCSGTKKITANLAHVCVCSMIMNAPYSGQYLQKVDGLLKTKVPTARAFGIEWLQVLMECHGPLLSEMENIFASYISKGLSDATPQVRSAARRAFWTLNHLWGKTGNDIVSKLDKSSKKALFDLKPEDKPKEPKQDSFNITTAECSYFDSSVSESPVKVAIPETVLEVPETVPEVPKSVTETVLVPETVPEVPKAATEAVEAVETVLAATEPAVKTEMSEPTKTKEPETPSEPFSYGPSEPHSMQAEPVSSIEEMQGVSSSESGVSHEKFSLPELCSTPYAQMDTQSTQSSVPASLPMFLEEEPLEDSDLKSPKCLDVDSYPLPYKQFFGSVQDSVSPITTVITSTNQEPMSMSSTPSRSPRAISVNEIIQRFRSNPDPKGDPLVEDALVSFFSHLQHPTEAQTDQVRSLCVDLLEQTLGYVNDRAIVGAAISLLSDEDLDSFSQLFVSLKGMSPLLTSCFKVCEDSDPVNAERSKKLLSRIRVSNEPEAEDYIRQVKQELTVETIPFDNSYPDHESLIELSRVLESPRESENDEPPKEQLGSRSLEKDWSVVSAAIVEMNDQKAFAALAAEGMDNNTIEVQDLIRLAHFLGEAGVGMESRYLEPVIPSLTKYFASENRSNRELQLSLWLVVKFIELGFYGKGEQSNELAESLISVSSRDLSFEARYGRLHEAQSALVCLCEKSAVLGMETLISRFFSSNSRDARVFVMKLLRALVVSVETLLIPEVGSVILDSLASLDIYVRKEAYPLLLKVNGRDPEGSEEILEQLSTGQRHLYEYYKGRV